MVSCSPAALERYSWRLWTQLSSAGISVTSTPSPCSADSCYSHMALLGGGGLEEENWITGDAPGREHWDLSPSPFPLLPWLWAEALLCAPSTMPSLLLHRPKSYRVIWPDRNFHEANKLSTSVCPHSDGRRNNMMWIFSSFETRLSLCLGTQAWATTYRSYEG